MALTLLSVKHHFAIPMHSLSVDTTAIPRLLILALVTPVKQSGMAGCAPMVLCVAEHFPRGMEFVDA